MTPVEIERKTLEQRLKTVDTAIDKALGTKDESAFKRACGLRKQLKDRLERLVEPETDPTSKT